MRLEQSVVIDADAARVWTLLCDPESAAGCVPGVRLRGRDGDGHYLGDLTVRFGPTRVTFSGIAEIVMKAEDMSGTIVARGADRQGRSRASGTLRFQLVPVGNAVRLTSSADITISGGLARFAESGGRHIAEQMLAGMAANVTERIRADRLASADEPEPASGPVALTPRFSPLEVFTAWLVRLLRRLGRRDTSTSPER